VQVRITPVPITKLEKELKFPPLIVYFSDHAARLEELRKRPLSGVHLNPQIAGAWRWSADDILLFEPTEDWPAEQKFAVIFDRNFFSHHVLLEPSRCLPAQFAHCASGARGLVEIKARQGRPRFTERRGNASKCRRKAAHPLGGDVLSSGIGQKHDCAQQENRS